MFVLSLLDDLFIDEVPLRHRPTILANIFTQFGDGVVLAGMVSAGCLVIFLEHRLFTLRGRQAGSEPWHEASSAPHEPASWARKPHEASSHAREAWLHVRRRGREVTHLEHHCLTTSSLGFLLTLGNATRHYHIFTISSSWKEERF